jgi:ABC-type lipoprotein export system ATPase subunit
MNFETESTQNAPIVELKQVCKTYLDGNVQALRNVDLCIRDQEFVAIMGPSGCGKSTLLNMLGALDRPTSGSIEFQGKTLNNKTNLDSLRSKQIGFVFQSFYLLPNLTAVENVQLPMFESELALPERVLRARELLKLVGLEDRIDHLPNQLSIGQRQRVAIARALANKPRIVLADEPTGSLDSHNGQEVMELFQSLNEQQETAIVVVTHDENVALHGKRLVRMLDGQILEDTPVPSLSR